MVSLSSWGLLSGIVQRSYVSLELDKTIRKLSLSAGIVNGSMTDNYDG
jgi:hypothetical protein